MSTPPHDQTSSLLRREMGLRDVLLFNIAAVLGPRWIAAAAHNGPSSLSLWLLAAIFFFVPTSFVVVELSTRFPDEGGLYIWTKQAFGDFHGFVAGWAYWVYTLFYFPGLLMASAAMAAYVGGERFAYLANSRNFLVTGSLLLLAVAVGMNIVGLNIGKWLQNAGGIGTYVPLMVLVAVGIIFYGRHGSHTPITLHSALPRWNLDTVNFWSQIAFAFTGLEMVCTMAEEVKNPHKTFPRAVLGSGILIAIIYMLGTVAILFMLPPDQVDPKSGVFQAITSGSVLMGVGFVGIIAALLVTAGNAGGVGATVAAAARVPFAVGIDRYLPEFFGKLHPRWRTPYISMLIQAVVSAAILLVSQINETTAGAYQLVIDAAIILYFLPFLYMYAAVIRLAYKSDRRANPRAVLIPGGKPGVWIMGTLGFAVTALSIVLSMVPPGEVVSKGLFELKLIGTTAIAVLIGLLLHWWAGRKA